MKESEFLFMNETASGVFHMLDWGQELPENFLNQLVEKARVNPNRKARLCLHPSPTELLQVTYLAFFNPYSDKIHCHPHRVEVLVPILGQAKHTTFNAAAQAVSSKIIDGSFPAAISTAQGTWHAIEVLTPIFVMIEIGTGPFLRDSTTFL
jgi:cupin fold WbuC family metalloprotein